MLDAINHLIRSSTELQDRIRPTTRGSGLPRSGTERACIREQIGVRLHRQRPVNGRLRRPSVGTTGVEPDLACLLQYRGRSARCTYQHGLGGHRADQAQLMQDREENMKSRVHEAEG